MLKAILRSAWNCKIAIFGIEYNIWITNKSMYNVYIMLFRLSENMGYIIVSVDLDLECSRWHKCCRTGYTGYTGLKFYNIVVRGVTERCAMWYSCEFCFNYFMFVVENVWEYERSWKINMENRILCDSFVIRVSRIVNCGNVVKFQKNRIKPSFLKCVIFNFCASLRG